MSDIGSDLPFVGIPTFCKFAYSRELTNVDIAIVGAPLDQGTTNRTGARNGPKAIREGSQIYGAFMHPEKGIYDVELEKFILSNLKAIDYGDIPVAPTLSDLNLDLITSVVRNIVRKDVFPVVLGGDHSITFPVVRALKKDQIDIVHFDTHTDFLDDEFGIRFSHANPIKRASELKNVNRITQIGIRGLLNPIYMTKESLKYGSKIVTAQRALKEGIEWTIDQIPEAEKMYVTIDIDALDPSCAPGTGTPEPGGFNYLQMREMLRALPEKGKIVGFDLVEVNPLYDPTGMTGQVAARLIIDFLGAIMEKR